ncbi:glutamine amidotransferase-related protein [Legionella feeleii]|uniref:Glutamine amidotransferase, class I n=1 Tax=Legionella feeleii TaxID=453 RepID=A0A378IRF8_9GAMM|nr:GMP synthase [Legionella feeleii]STX37818.1 glutamine amidotransferase, class I [Legionella feeleii]
MNLGLLQCDEVQEKFAPVHGRYPDMFARLLKKADPSLEFVVYDVRQGELPITIDTCDAYLITGSRHGVNDDLPWIRVLEDFVLQLNNAAKKVIGICFGHQLIAKALGGEVIKSPKSWGVGMSQNKMTQQKPWMIPQRDNFKLLVSHQDQVVTLPLNAEILAGSDFCPFYMLQFGDNLFTIQGHPEFTKAYSQALIEDRERILGKECYEQGLKSLQQDADDELIAQWIINFLRG